MIKLDLQCGMNTDDWRCNGLLFTYEWFIQLWTQRITLLILHFVETGTCWCQRPAIRPFAKPLMVLGVTGGSSISQYTLGDRRTLDRSQVWANTYRHNNIHTQTHTILFRVSKLPHIQLCGNWTNLFLLFPKSRINHDPQFKNCN